VGVTGPSAAALGEQHDRQSQTLDQFEQSVLLGMVALPLRAGEDRVVVGHDRAPLTVDAPDASDESIRRCLFDQLLNGAAGALCADPQRTVLLEAGGIAQVRQVLPRPAQADPAPTLHPPASC